MDLWTDVSDPIPNEDGSTTYEVTTHIRNAMTPEESLVQVKYVLTGNPVASSPTSLYEYVLLMAPEGGSITDVYRNGEWIDPEEDSISKLPASRTLYDKNTWNFVVDVPVASQVDLSYRVTTAPGATEPLEVRHTPTARTFE